MCMSFLLKVPKEHLHVIEKILNLDEEQKEIIYNKFKAYKPKKFDEEIKDIKEFKDYPEIFELISILFKISHNLVEDQIFSDIDSFISDIIGSFIERYDSKSYDTKDEKIISLKQYLNKILTIDTGIFYFEKAVKLLAERSKLIENTRIITDIRPVFKEQKIEPPDYCLITHNLRINYVTESRDKKKVYFALDRQDLIELKSQIDRALEKEKELQKLCQKIGLEIFEV